jgi:hypothetical protein
MVALLVVAVTLIVISIVGEALEARFQHLRGPAGRLVDRDCSALPEPLIPSTIQRSAGGG